MWHNPPEVLETPAQIGAAIKSRRASRGITQSDLEIMTGISQANISRIEKGSRDAGISTYLRIFEALGIDLTLKMR